MKIAFINQFGNHEVHELPQAPRIGDTVPIFYKPWPKVQNVVWMPEKAFPEMKGVDCLVTLE